MSATNLITRGFGENPSIIGGGFGEALSAAAVAVTEEATRRRRRGRRAIDEFEEFFIRASLVKVNGKRVDSNAIQGTQKAQIINESDVSVRASGVKVNYFNSAASRIVITARKILKG